MKRTLIIAAAALCLAACTDNSLPRAQRDDINTARFDSMFLSMDMRPTDELHSLLVVKDDAVIYENYSIGHGPDELHICWSASKTFTAIGVGFAQQDGLLNVDDPVMKFFDEDELPEEQNEWFQEMRIRDLLMMSSGFADERFAGKDNSITRPSVNQLASPVVYKPSTEFHYNSMNTYLCSVIVSKVTGMKLVDYLKGKFFDPLGITPEQYVWDESVEGYSYGGWGLHITAEGLAKAGLFMLHRGVWNGKRLLFDEWFDEAMSQQIIQGDGTPNWNSDWGCGYGFQMWKLKVGDGYRFDGAWGQFCLVMPEKNAVAAIFSHASRTYMILDDFWKYVYPEL